MRRVLSIALLALATPLAAADMPELRSRGTLRVLVSADEEPHFFSFEASGEPGFERELLQGFASLHGLRVEPVAVSHFETIVADLVSGKGDVITGIIDNEGRRKQIDFTTEVLPARHVAVTCRPAPVLEAVEQLRRERVGTIRGTTWATVAAGAGIAESNLKTFPDVAALFAALCSGRITAAVTSVSDATLALRKEPRIQPGVLLGEAQSAAWGVRKTDAALRQAMDEYLGNARRGPTWSRLVVKYFGDDALRILGRASSR